MSHGTFGLAGVCTRRRPGRYRGDLDPDRRKTDVSALPRMPVAHHAMGSPAALGSPCPLPGRRPLRVPEHAIGMRRSSDDDWEQVHVYVPAGTAKVGFRVNRKGTRWWSGYYGNVAIDQVVLECGGGPPAPPAPPPALCTDDCPPYPHYTSDGWCDDGGSESQYSLCPLGSDCQVRTATQTFCPRHALSRLHLAWTLPSPPHTHPIEQDCGPRIIAEPCDIEMDLVRRPISERLRWPASPPY